LWDYEPDDEEWSEDYRVGRLGITVSNFLVSSVEHFLDDVVLRASTDPVRHMRMAALQRSRPLLGAELMASWRAQADAFPGKLVSACAAAPDSSVPDRSQADSTIRTADALRAADEDRVATGYAWSSGAV